MYLTQTNAAIMDVTRIDVNPSGIPGDFLSENVDPEALCDTITGYHQGSELVDFKTPSQELDRLDQEVKLSENDQEHHFQASSVQMKEKRPHMNPIVYSRVNPLSKSAREIPQRERVVGAKQSTCKVNKSRDQMKR